MNNRLGENLIFLISQPRAGSTLLQRILAGHPEIHTTAEPWIMLHPLYALKREGYSTEYDANLARVALDDFCQNLDKGQEAYIEAIRHMGLLLYDNALMGTDKIYFLDKTPRYYFVIPELHRVFPKASYIILLRNPLAVLSSILDTWIGEDWNRLALHRHDLLKAPSLLADGIVHLKNQVIVVYYEDLVTNPEQTIRLLCEDLQIEFYPAMLEYGKNAAPRGRMGDALGIHRHTRPVVDYVDKWIGRLASPQRRYLAETYLAVLGSSLLSRMGYSFGELHHRLLSIECSEDSPDKRSAAEILMALGFDSRAMDLLKRMGIEHYARGDLAGAEQSFRLALDQAPHDSDVLVSLGRIYYDMQQHEKALNYLGEAIQLNPHDAEAWIGVALIARHVDDRETFQMAYQQAKALDPTHPKVMEMAPESLYSRPAAPEG